MDEIYFKIKNKLKEKIESLFIYIVKYRKYKGKIDKNGLNFQEIQQNIWNLGK